MEKKYLSIDEKYRELDKKLNKKKTKLEQDHEYCLANSNTEINFVICMKKRGWKVENI